MRNLLALLAWCALAATAADLRLGIIGTDTSHVSAFTKLLNDGSSPQHVPGARVVAAFKGGSKDLPDSYKRVDKFAEELRTKWNVEFVPDIPSLCSKVDGVMLESVDGRQHLEQVKQALACGKPISFCAHCPLLSAVAWGASATFPVTSEAMAVRSSLVSPCAKDAIVPVVIALRTSSNDFDCSTVRLGARMSLLPLS